MTIGSFDHIRVQGSFEVVVAASHGSGAVVSGDEAAVERVEVAVDGGTLTVRDWSNLKQAGEFRPEYLH